MTVWLVVGRKRGVKRRKWERLGEDRGTTGESREAECWGDRRRKTGMTKNNKRRVILIMTVHKINIIIKI